VKKVILKFKTVKELWEFKMLAKAPDVEINLKRCTIICNCSEADILLAIDHYNAELLERTLR